jgi:ABC-type polysaccharide/polyol phosphate transport system ATPase subunit
LNGAGKSTLLQILTGILKPTSGNFEVSGKISSILELGSGFDPNFSGIENINLYFQMTGDTGKCNDDIINKIVTFANLEKFINNKLYTYSTGMIARLAFSVRIFQDFDILIIDEILSVGDIIFQKKCFDYFSKIRAQGKTIICVSHSLNQVLEISDRVCLLDNGKLIAVDKPKKCVYEYMKRVNNLSRVDLDLFTKNISNNKSKKDYFNSIKCNGTDKRIVFLKTYEKVFFQIELDTSHKLSDLSVGFNIRTIHGIKIAGKINPIKNLHNKNKFTLEYTCELNKGEYFLSFNLILGNNSNFIFLDRRLDCFVLNVEKDCFESFNSGYFILKSKII